MVSHKPVGQRREYKRQDPLDRFMSKVKIGDTCWIWTGKVNNKGYPKFSERAVWVYAHRWIYERLVEPIPDGLELDHTCHVPACVNPDHLEPVTHAENMRRRRILLAPTCRNGHPRTPENTAHRKGRGTRVCRACARDQYHKHKRKA